MNSNSLKRTPPKTDLFDELGDEPFEDPPEFQKPIKLAPEDISSPDASKENRQSYLILPHHVKSIWPSIEPLLLKMKKGEYSSVFDFLEVITNIISLHYKSRKDIDVSLLLYFFETFDAPSLNYFTSRFMPFIASIALEIKTLFPESIRIFKQNKEQSITFQRRQIVCLVANMFLCTFHKQNNLYLSSQANFIKLFRGSSQPTSRTSLKLNKIKCFYHFLKTMEDSMASDTLIFYHRLVFSPSRHKTHSLDTEFWQKSKKKMCPLQITPRQSIENAAYHHDSQIEGEKNGIQVIFGNKRVGGGVLGEGGFQEELYFCRYPELLPAILLFEQLEDLEAAFYAGAQRYVDSEGYGSEFKFIKGYKEESIKKDIFERKDVAMVAIDAFNFKAGDGILEKLVENERQKESSSPKEVLLSSSTLQFSTNLLLRELNKAFVGFSASDALEEEESAPRRVVSGKWGCGDFEGDFQLKIIIQWLAASQAGRKIQICIPEGGLEGWEEVERGGSKMNVGEMFKVLEEFGKVKEGGVDVGMFEFFRDFVDL